MIFLGFLGHVGTFYIAEYEKSNVTGVRKCIS